MSNSADAGLDLAPLQHAFATGVDRAVFARLALEQYSRTETHRCPIGRASSDVVEALLEHWAMSAQATAPMLEPLLQSFERVHALGLRFFLRMWADSSAFATSSNDFHRVGAIVRSQLGEVLRDEASLVKGGLARAWQNLEDGLLRSEYQDIKERMIKETEARDDVTQQPTIRYVFRFLQPHMSYSLCNAEALATPLQ